MKIRRDRQNREEREPEESLRAVTPKKRRALPFVASVLLFLAITVSFVIRQVGVTSAQRNLAELETEIERYKAMNGALESQIELLRTDEYIEKIARNKLGLVKPGEIRYMMVTHTEGQ